MQTLDSFCHSNGIKRINYLKIDAEGHDLEVLKGAQALLAGQDIDLLQVEAGISPQNALHVPLERFREFLSSHNYHLFGFYDQCTEWPTGEPHLRRVNAVFVSSKVIEDNRHSPPRVTGLTRIKASLAYRLKRALEKARAACLYARTLVLRNYWYSDSSMTFVMQVYKDYELATAALTRLRKFHPASRLIVISDGDPDPRYRNFVDQFGAEYTEGERLFNHENGGRMLHRWLEHFMQKPSPYFIRIDSDTRFDRRFRYLPIPCGAEMFGNIETSFRSIQGGCIVFSYAAAKKLYDSRIFLSETLKDYRGTWGKVMEEDLLMQRIRQGLICSDWVLRYACSELGIRRIDFHEIHSRWKELIPNLDKRYAVVHPDKNMS